MSQIILSSPVTIKMLWTLYLLCSGWKWRGDGNIWQSVDLVKYVRQNHFQFVFQFYLEPVFTDWIQTLKLNYLGVDVVIVMFNCKILPLGASFKKGGCQVISIAMII